MSALSPMLKINKEFRRTSICSQICSSYRETNLFELFSCDICQTKVSRARSTTFVKLNEIPGEASDHPEVGGLHVMDNILRNDAC